MKSFFALLCATAIFLTSCNKDPLDIIPSNKLSDATVWTDSTTANLFLNDIYNQLNAGPWSSVFTNLPTEVSNDPLDNLTDNTCYGPTGTPSYSLFDNSSYGPSAQLFGPQWANMYANIRKCNLCIDKVTGSSFTDGTKKSMIAQARFLRAYFYKSLIDIYGGVPIITKVLDNSTQGDSIFYARNTYDECVAWIQSECQAAAADLPATTSGNNVGRAISGAALALKGEEELYAGKWSDAAATNYSIIQSNRYSLYPDYTGLFYTQHENNQEVIFDIQYSANIKPKHINQYWGVVEVAKGAGWGGSAPTQDLVDEYEFTDGLTAAQGSAMYDPNHPYVNREKRFYASIIYDGSVWRGETIYTRLGITNNANEINVTGKSGNAGRTGYFTRKLQDSTIASTANNLDGTNVIVWRYAEVLLNYAEAQNEATGPDQTVYDAMHLVRQRAGQPDLPAGLSQSDMRDRIRHERRIELAFEGKRFYDILRWRTAEQIFSKPIHGMKITSVGGNLVYTVVNIRNVVFNPAKNYLQPLPQTVIDQNPKLKQNPIY